jgi:hypothetical protein
VCCPEADTCPDSYRFEAFIDVIPGVRGEPTINGLGTSVTIGTEPVSLTVTFDPTAWWQIVDYGRLASLDDGSGTVFLEPGDPDYSAVVIAMSGNPPPTFTWSTDHEMN